MVDQEDPTISKILHFPESDPVSAMKEYHIARIEKVIADILREMDPDDVSTLAYLSHMEPRKYREAIYHLLRDELESNDGRKSDKNG